VFDYLGANHRIESLGPFNPLLQCPHILLRELAIKPEQARPPSGLLDLVLVVADPKAPEPVCGEIESHRAIPAAEVHDISRILWHISPNPLPPVPYEEVASL
jgi:hypothetical protein